MKTLLVSENSGVLSVSLHRPEVRNAFSSEMIAELTDLFTSVGRRADLRAVRLSGEGKTFCAGADLSYMQEMVKYSMQQNQADSLAMHGMFEAIFQSPVPVVTQVHGAAFGGALGLIAASDIVIADEKTQFCFSEVKLGLVPAVISDFVLRKSSLGLVAPAMLTGQVFTAAEARRMGLVHAIGETTVLDGLTEKSLRSFREAGPEAVRETKKLIQSVPVLSRDQVRAQVSRVISERRVSNEGQEGIKAFLEKRVASWRLS